MIFSNRMRGHSGLIFTLSATLLLMALSSTVDAVTLKIATLAPDGTSWMKQMRKGAKEIGERTDGRVKIAYIILRVNAPVTSKLQEDLGLEPKAWSQLMSNPSFLMLWGLK